MLRQRSFAVMFALLALSQSALGHTLAFRRCPSVRGVQDFDVEKFAGKWFVIEVYSVVNSCITLEYEPQEEGKVKISQGRQLTAVDALGVDHTTNYVGRATYGSATPSQMVIEWPSLGFLGEMSHVVVATSGNYSSALTFECQDVVGLLSRVSAAILSRTPTLDTATLEQYKQAAKDAGIPSTGNFKAVDQQQCLQDGEGLHLDTEVFNLLGLVSEDKINTISTKEELLAELGVENA